MPGQVQDLKGAPQEVQRRPVLVPKVWLGSDARPAGPARQIQHRIPIPISLDGMNSGRHRSECLEKLFDSPDVVVVTMSQKHTPQFEFPLSNELDQGIRLHAAVDDVTPSGIGPLGNAEQKTVGLDGTQRSGLDHGLGWGFWHWNRVAGPGKTRPKCRWLV